MSASSAATPDQRLNSQASDFLLRFKLISANAVPCSALPLSLRSDSKTGLALANTSAAMRATKMALEALTM